MSTPTHLSKELLCIFRLADSLVDYSLIGRNSRGAGIACYVEGGEKCISSRCSNRNDGFIAVNDALSCGLAFALEPSGFHLQGPLFVTRH